jgi:hypothetical protein
MNRSQLRHRYLRKNQGCASVDQAGAETKLATGHPFDDEHGAAANRTAQLGSDRGISCTVVCAKQSTAV